MNGGDLEGQLLGGKYLIEDVIGRGGFGTVYRAAQQPVGRAVAVKVIAAGQASRADVRSRFLREASMVAAISHPAVVTLIDYGEDAGRLYMVLEFIDGEEIAAVIAREAPLEPARVMRLVRQVAAGLSEAHAHDMVHRDLKPSNLMVSCDRFGDEWVRVLDFGLAKVFGDAELGFHTRTGVALGTPAYMAPEQAVARDIGPWTDQYALGVITYEMLTGRRPFGGDTAFEVLASHRTQPVPALPAALGLPRALDEVLGRAMGKERDERYPDVRAFAHAMERALIDHGLTISGSGSLRSDTERPASGPTPTLLDVDEPDVLDADALVELSSGMFGDDDDTLVAEGKPRGLRSSPPIGQRAPAGRLALGRVGLGGHVAGGAVKWPPQADTEPDRRPEALPDLAPITGRSTSAALSGALPSDELERSGEVLSRPRRWGMVGLVMVALSVGVVGVMAWGSGQGPPPPPPADAGVDAEEAAPDGGADAEGGVTTVDAGAAPGDLALPDAARPAPTPKKAHRALKKPPAPKPFERW